MGNELLVLQAEKNAAVENEDYGLAKQLKAKIDQLKDAAQHVDETDPVVSAIPSVL